MIPELPIDAIGLAYRERLSPWCVVCFLPNLQRSVVSRHRRRADAEEHLKAVRRLNQAFEYAIVFDSAIE